MTSAQQGRESVSAADIADAFNALSAAVVAYDNTRNCNWLEGACHSERRAEELELAFSRFVALVEASKDHP